jgi:hypothetical protein
MKVLITGGTNGMGKGVAKALAKCTSESNDIIILCRSETLGQKTINELRTENPGVTPSLVLCNLADLRSVQHAVATIKEHHDSLDSIFVNAGIGYASQRNETIDGMDSHFQVNYLSQFYLVVQLLELLEKSTRGGRVIFNATPGGKIQWDDIQLSNHWNYEKAIHQAMTAKRMLLITLHDLYKEKSHKVSFLGFSIHKTVWSNQINIIPTYMRIMATVMKAFGSFISIEKCGEIMVPLFMEDATAIGSKSGSFITGKRNRFIKLQEDDVVQNEGKRRALLEYSLNLCGDDSTRQIIKILERREGT